MPCSGKVFTLFTKLFGVLQYPYQLLCESNAGAQLLNLLAQISSQLGKLCAAVWQLVPRRSNLTGSFVKNQLKTIFRGLLQLGPWVYNKFRELTGAAAAAQQAQRGGVMGGGGHMANSGPGTPASSAGGGDYSAFYSGQAAGLVQRSSVAAAGPGAAAGAGGGADLFVARPWPEQKRAD